MAGVNKAILLGRLGQDPQINQTTSGKKYANFSIATSESYTPKEGGDRVEKTTWHNCTAWSPLAEVIEKYVKKGSEIYVEGKMEAQEYEDKNQVTVRTTRILVSSLNLIGGKAQSDGTAQAPAPQRQAQAPAPVAAQVSDDDMDLPF